VPVSLPTRVARSIPRTSQKSSIRPVRADAAVPPGERGSDVAPEVAGDEDAVDEEEHLAVAALAVSDRALLELYLARLAELR
jgi:hypothetical protein